MQNLFPGIFWGKISRHPEILFAFLFAVLSDFLHNVSAKYNGSLKLSLHSGTFEGLLKGASVIPVIAVSVVSSLGFHGRTHVCF